MNTTIPTPITDAEERELCQRSKEASELPNNWNHVVRSSTSRMLERDLANSRAAIVRISAEKDQRISELKSKLALAQDDLARMTAELEGKEAKANNLNVE